MGRQFNGDLLRTARNARGWSQTQLAKEAGISQGKLSKLENKLIDHLTDDELIRIASTLAFPQSFFLEPDDVIGLPFSVHPMFRKRSSVGSRHLEQLQAQLNLRLFHIRRLLQSVTIEADLQLPDMDIDEFDSPEQIAGLLRRTWGVPIGPIKNLVAWVERASCLVVLGEFGTSAVDGVTLRFSAMHQCIFLNRNQPIDRLRYTLAHELGHIVMHRVPSPTMELEANVFASELLMPAEQIRTEFSGRRITLATLAALKPVWSVSMQALLVRATNLGLIDQSRSTYLWRQMSARGFRKVEPVALHDQEQPTVHPELIRVHIEDLGYSTEDLCSLLHVLEDDLRWMHPLPHSARRQHMRLVQ